MRAVRIGAIVASAAIAASLHQLRAAEPPPITIAVVRGDGILIPFATRTGDRWTNTWPTPAGRIDIPVRLADLPKPWWGKAGPAATWHAWFVDGGSATATVDRPAWYLSYCQHGVGLQTGVTARPPLAPQTVRPYPKLGLAATGEVAFQRIESLDSRHPIGAALLDVLAKPFRDSEAREYLALANPGPDESSLRPARPPVQQPGALRLDGLHRMPRSDGQFLYYYEVSRRYPEATAASPASAGPGRHAAPDTCAGVSFATGWFVGTATKVPAGIPVRVDLMSCDYDRALLMQPLGSLTDGRGAYWIAQMSGWDRERYVVLRANAKRAAPDVLVSTPAGRCD
jgi:hypothetical protein